MSERHPDCKVECEVSREVRMQYRVVFPAVVVCGRDGFHSGVEPEYEVSEVQSQTDAVSYGDLFVEAVEAELSSRLALVVAHGPDVSGIDEGRAVEFPEEWGAVFDVQVELYVACLVDEVYSSVCPDKRSGAQFAHAPPSDAV